MNDQHGEPEALSGDGQIDGTSGNGPGPQRVVIDAGGGLTLPRDFLAAMGLPQGGPATLCVRNGELVILTPMAALTKLRRLAMDLGVDGARVVDEFIAEKRAEVAE